MLHGRPRVPETASRYSTPNSTPGSVPDPLTYTTGYPGPHLPHGPVQMKIEDIAVENSTLATMRAVNFEVTKDTLSTMLDGMGKILEQLNSVADQQ